MSPKISLIAPVYNVAHFLPRAIASMCAQTYSNIEIILVDDGSPDDSGKICDDFAQKDSRIKVIHKKNEGSGMARNAGMEIATGDFFIFPDPDDVMSPDQIEYLLSLTKGEHDVIPCCDYFSTETPPQREEIITTFEGEAIIFKVLRDSLTGVWNKLFPAPIAKKIQFPRLYRAQDTVFCIQALLNCRQFVFSNQCKYFYRINEYGVSLRPFRDNDFDLVQAYRKVLDMIPQDSAYHDVRVQALISYVDAIHSIYHKMKRSHIDVIHHPLFAEHYHRIQNDPLKIRWNAFKKNKHTMRRMFILLYFMQRCKIERFLLIRKLVAELCRLFKIK